MIVLLFLWNLEILSWWLHGHAVLMVFPFQVEVALLEVFEQQCDPEMIKSSSCVGQLLNCLSWALFDIVVEQG